MVPKPTLAWIGLAKKLGHVSLTSLQRDPNEPSGQPNTVSFFLLNCKPTTLGTPLPQPPHPGGELRKSKEGGGLGTPPPLEGSGLPVMAGAFHAGSVTGQLVSDRRPPPRAAEFSASHLPPPLSGMTRGLIKTEAFAAGSISFLQRRVPYFMQPNS